MNSWQLGVFFIFGLMLFAAVFSNTVLAADGAGKAIVNWGAYSSDRSLPDLDKEELANDPDVAVAHLPLDAGTRRNRIKIIYTAEAGDNMGGGSVRVKLPGWPISQISGDNTHKNAHGIASKNRYHYVLITSQPTGATSPTILYETATGTTGLSDNVTKDNLAMVQTISKDMVEVKLSDDWKRGGTLRIRFGSIRTGVPPRLPFFQEIAQQPEPNVRITGYVRYANYQLTVYSRTKNGFLVPLKKQPSVRVGNINPGAQDILEREFTVEPATVYQGEKGRAFKITFTAPGPMYVTNAPPIDLEDEDYPRIIINIPPGMRPAADPSAITVSGQGVVKFTTANNDQNTRIRFIRVFLDGFNQGQTVTVRYKADINQPNEFKPHHLRILMAGSEEDDDATVDATKISGGASKPVDGSGKVKISPVAVEAGSRRVNITLTYTAATDLENKVLRIVPKGIVIDETNKLQIDNPAGYGYVSGSMPGIRTGGIDVGWTNITLKKNKSVTVTIHGVDIVSEAKEYQWLVHMGEFGSGFSSIPLPVERPPILSVTKTSGDAVDFEIVGTDPTYLRAGGNATITFRFTAESTPIRDGSVSLTIPEALGSKPAVPKSEKEGQIKVLGIDNKHVTVSGRVVTFTIKRLALGGSVKIEYGTTQEKGKQAVLGYTSGDYKVTGTFRVSANTSIHPVDPVTIKLGKIGDGVGLTSKTQSPVTLAPTTTKAGSRTGNAIKITFTAAGTMDGGQVALEIPIGWGLMQENPTKRNYVMTDPVPGSAIIKDIVVEANGRRAVATINKLGRGGSFSFIYGGGTVPPNNGVEVQNDVGVAEFMVLSDGNGDGVFTIVDSLFEQSGRQKILNFKKVGKILKGAAGVLKIEVTSPQDGTGEVTFEGDTSPAVRAADDNVQLVFVYTPIQTIQYGELKFTVPGGWSPPQVDNIGNKGYTEVVADGLGSVSAEGPSVTVPIFFLNREQTIKITYGASSDAAGRVMASTATGDAAFKFAVKGHEKGNLVPIAPVTLTVGPQASGKGKALINAMGDTLHAGDADRKIKMVYTAAGQMIAGQVQLDIPTGWSAPTAESVTAMIDMTPATPAFTNQMITVNGVDLLKNGTVTFVYTGIVQPQKADGVKFAVASHGGLETDSFAAVAGKGTMLTVDVQEARSGSGMAMVSPRVVQAGATGVNLTFTYTAVGKIGPPREFRVEVPTSWGTPTNAPSAEDTKNTYTVKHRDSRGGLIGTSVEKLPPRLRKMGARVRVGGLNVEAGDEIIFTYQNADAPATPEISNFVLIFGGKPIADSVQVRIQDSTPSMLLLQSAGTVSADEGARPLGIIVGLRDADGNAVAMNSDVAVTLTSTSATGAFSMMAGEAGTENTTVTIMGGDVSATVYYTDSTAGTATITAIAAGLMSTTHEVMVTTSMIEITSVTVSPTVTKDGDTVTVTAMGTAGQTATFSVGSIVTDKAMTEVTSGSYSGSFMVVANQHPDGMYDVTVTLGDVSMTPTDRLTIDSTMPTVEVTAAPESAANGDMVMLSATVTDASAISSVSAEVSMLDSSQTDPVTLAMGDDGAYSASVTISDENENANGSKTITVTAMDAAGNSGTGEAAVELNNTLSYTSMIPAGISLYHVPLDVEGLDTVGDLKTALGDAVSIATVYDRANGSWNSRSDDVAITADLGMILSTTAEISHTFEGQPWGGGTSMIRLQVGSNLIGLPVNDPSVTNVSDIAGLFTPGVVTNVLVSTADGFASVAAAGDAGDGPVTGDAAYLVIATADATALINGAGWIDKTMVGAAPVALAGYSVDGQTPVLDVNGSVVDEITGLAREGFRVKVKNLSTKASLSKITSVETAEGYNMTFVDLKAGNAARIGDILEISADSPSPSIGVQPVRHIVTVDDVKNSRIQLEDLIAYEIPAETELLRNYPNPFNPETWIPFRLAEDAFVTLTIYDGAGRVVRTLDVGHRIAGTYESRSKAIHWDGRNEVEEQVASDLYFYHLSAGDFSATRKMVILK